MGALPLFTRLVQNYFTDEDYDGSGPSGECGPRCRFEREDAANVSVERQLVDPARLRVRCEEILRGRFVMQIVHGWVSSGGFTGMLPSTGCRFLSRAALRRMNLCRRASRSNTWMRRLFRSAT